MGIVAAKIIFSTSLLVGACYFVSALRLGIKEGVGVARSIIEAAVAMAISIGISLAIAAAIAGPILFLVFA